VKERQHRRLGKLFQGIADLLDMLTRKNKWWCEPATARWSGKNRGCVAAACRKKKGGGEGSDMRSGYPSYRRVARSGRRDRSERLGMQRRAGTVPEANKRAAQGQVQAAVERATTAVSERRTSWEGQRCPLAACPRTKWDQRQSTATRRSRGGGAVTEADTR
jgi:hypothetical protein